MPVFKARLTVNSVMEVVTGKEIGFEELNGKRAWAVCGIAYPSSFEKTLHELSMDIAGWSVFRDHQDYTREDFEAITRLAGDLPIVTTEKDWVKWEGRHPFREVFVVSVRMELIDGEEFYDFIEGFVYNKVKSVQGGTG